MAITVQTQSASNQNIPTSENGASFKYTGAFSTENASYLVNYGFDGDLYVLVGSGYLQSKTYSKTWTNKPSDTTYSIHAWAHRSTPGGEDGEGSDIDLKTNAMVIAVSNPQATNVQETTATISWDFNRRTHESDATTWLEYKKSSDSTWIQAGAVDFGSGFGVHTITRNLTGLTPGTQYDYRIRMTRTTNNDTSLAASGQTFTTLSGASLIVVTY